MNSLLDVAAPSRFDELRYFLSEYQIYIAFALLLAVTAIVVILLINKNKKKK